MGQGILPFEYGSEKLEGLTALGGLPVYLELIDMAGLGRSVETHVGARSGGQGWSDSQLVLSLVLLNLAGGGCVNDIQVFEKDEGFWRVLFHTVLKMRGVRRKERREAERKAEREFRKEGGRCVPSPSAIFRYLHLFHDPKQEGFRVPHKAFIPAPNKYLRGMVKVNADFLAFLQKNRPQAVATLDMDATLVATQKMGALWCYKGFPSYQPLNTWWAEQGVIVHTEFRDGNVPAGYEQTRILEEALACLPEGVEVVRVRSDTAGYQHELLRYCAKGSNERFGRIEFAIGSDVTPEFKKAVAEVPESEWKPLVKTVDGWEVNTGKEWAEVCFVPKEIAKSKKGPEYRYMATREVLQEQQCLPGIGEQRELPFPTMPMKSKRYKVFGIVTNMDWEGGKLIHWLHERCGKSEEAHSVMKEDLAGGTLPSGDFGANAAWWWIMILALNLNAAMKNLVLQGSWRNRRMKAIRFGLIHLPARVILHARQLVVRLSERNPLLDWLVEIRSRIEGLIPASTG